MIPDIQLPQIDGASIYSSRRADDIKQDNEFRIGGHKKWEYALVPQKAGRIIVPPLSFSFFDPEQKRYATVDSSSIELTAAGSDGASIPGFPGIKDQESQPPALPINDPFYRQPWFYGISAILLLCVIGTIALATRKGRPAPPSPKTITPGQTALALLRLAEKEAVSNPRRFYDQAAAALSGFLCDKFGLSEIEIAEDALEKALSARSIRSIDQNTVREIKACLQECDFGRFVEASKSSEKHRELSNRIRKAIGLFDD
jgi:hypothetical protein